MVAILCEPCASRLGCENRAMVTADYMICDKCSAKVPKTSFYDVIKERINEPYRINPKERIKDIPIMGTSLNPLI